MDESTVGTEVSQSPGRGPIPATFDQVVEAFCLDMAAIRSRLANVGRGRDGVPRDGPIRGRHWPVAT